MKQKPNRKRRDARRRSVAPAADGLLNRVAETIERYQMLSGGERVLVAVSGGPDSVALWRALLFLTEQMSLTLAMVHVNYHLRGRESDADERFCRKLARDAGVQIYVRSRRRPCRAGKSFNLQDWARRVRYGIFESIARKENFDRIAVGHQYDDQVETIAAGLLGGRDSFAMAGIPRMRGRVMRPLFDCRRTEIQDFLERISQPCREDKSNRDLSYLRNRVRHEILPALRERYNPHIDAVLFRWAELVAEQTSFLQQTAVRWLKRSIVGWGSGWLSLDLKRLRRCDRRLDFYILHQTAVRLGLSKPVLGEKTVRRFGQLVKVGRAGQKLAWGKAIIEVSRAAMTFHAAKPVCPPPVEIKKKGTTRADGWDMRIICRRKARQKNADIRLPRGAWRLCSDAASIFPPLILRGPRPGERIRPLGMTGRRKVFDILSEAAVPSLLRPRTPVLEDRRGIFWVIGHHQDDRVKVTERTRELLLIEIKHAGQEQ